MTINLPLLRGTPTFVAGKFGNARSAGVFGVVGTQWDSAIGTVECWIKTITGAGGPILAVGNEGSAANGLWIGISGGQPSGATRSGGFTPGGPNVGGDGLWHHIAITCDGTTDSIFFDGNRISTKSSGGFGFQWGLGLGTATNAIGGFGANAGFDTPDVVDEVRISNNLRYSGTTYTIPTAAFTDDANTIALYHLEANGNDSHGVVAGGSSSTLSLADAEIAWLRANGGGALPASLKDLRRAVYTPDIFTYYSNLSGLTPKSAYSLNDHRLAYWKAQTAVAAGSLADRGIDFWT